ncbi:hypothetical protein CHARACLAT_003229 [Characodon lateralis]|uniref:Uncharacterized protein n=1 Tax=Characodon lateralis TaxID=208331 RepID=A0ABU7E6R1_9TELE|nr:hypothetical protein [Characodon lateralis]
MSEQEVYTSPMFVGEGDFSTPPSVPGLVFPKGEGYFCENPPFFLFGSSLYSFRTHKVVILASRSCQPVVNILPKIHSIGTLGFEHSADCRCCLELGFSSWLMGTGSGSSSSSPTICGFLLCIVLPVVPPNPLCPQTHSTCSWLKYSYYLKLLMFT